jgi:hypothetical protein
MAGMGSDRPLLGNGQQATCTNGEVVLPFWAGYVIANVSQTHDEALDAFKIV